MTQNIQYQPMPPYAPQTKIVKKMPGWGIALIIVLAVLFFFSMPIGFFFGTIVGSISGASSQASSTTMSFDDNVAVLHIEGTISSTQSSSFLSPSDGYDQSFLVSTVKDLVNDDTNHGILLYIDTPGGEVFATDELYLELMEYKKVTKRPIYAYCASMAASGGYYLACAADEILMNRNCLTGSIGVTAGTFIDFSGFLEEHGIKTTSVYVGDNKTMGSSYEEFTPEQKEIYTTILQETYDQFVDIVADARDLKRDDVVALADGRIYSPKQAVENGLVDEILSYEDAQAKMRKACDLEDSVVFVDYEPIYDVGLSSLFASIASANQSDLDSYLSHLDVPFDGPAYYYPG